MDCETTFSAVPSLSVSSKTVTESEVFVGTEASVLSVTIDLRPLDGRRQRRLACHHVVEILYLLWRE